jgi:EAL domain-containing protein (putative c-di-GMP-specific phosphodiesterase class I)
MLYHRKGKTLRLFNIEEDVVPKLLNEVSGSLVLGHFVLWLQPKKNIKTGEIHSAECLVRWDHPTRGLLGPDHFIPVLEKAGAINDLTRYVIKEATRHYKKLIAANIDISLSINVSPNDIVDPATMTTIIKSIVAADMLPHKLILEVTETAIMLDPDASFKVLVALESLGVKISIDDFGAGHSSMTYLKNFPIHEVKIDKSFITEIDSRKDEYNIVRTIIELSHSLGATVVAEGVETEKIANLLGLLQCDDIQGYHLSKPMQLDKFIEWINNRTSLESQ